MNARNPLWLAALLAGVAFLTLFLGRLAAVAPPRVPLAVVGVLFAGLVTLLNPRGALVLLVFSMLLSPELPVAQIPHRSVTVRVDDLLLVTIFLVWMGKTALSRGGAGFFVQTPLNRPIAAYTVICVLSTVKGILAGDVSGLKSGFYLLKYVEYFFLFILVSNLVTEKRQVRTYLRAGARSAFIVAVYAYAHIGSVDRLYAPFDYDANNVGEPATLGGYLLIVLCLCLALFTESDRDAGTLRAASALVLLFPPFVYTLSRASYLGYAAALTAIFGLTKRRRPLLFLLILAGVVTVPVVAPDLSKALLTRTRETFDRPSGYISVGGFRVGVESSAQERINSWRAALTQWLPAHPFLGKGITGVGLVDAQYPLVMGETGLAGLAAFLWLLHALFRTAWRSYRSAADAEERVLCLGFLLTLVALCVQSLTTNTFVIVRIMEPFWFLAALVARLPALREQAPPPEGVPVPAGAPA